MSGQQIPFRAALVSVWVVVASSLLCCALTACSADRDANPAPLVVVGVDGADWKVVEQLWQQGRLPHLRELANRGLHGPLHTFHYASPVIWTTIATGLAPRAHGITDFVVATPEGDKPVSSSLRRAPALWNMASVAGLQVAAIGWWASWPAEEVNGVVVSDRAMLDLTDRVQPPEYLPTYLSIERKVLDATPEGSLLHRADAVNAHCAIEQVAQRPDLTMLYLRGVDLASHFHWKHFEPRAFPAADPDEAEVGLSRIVAEYEHVDRTVGELLEATGGRANLFVLSDHGFQAMAREELRILLDLDRVLERLELLQRAGEGVDVSRSAAYSWDSPRRSLVKKVRFGGGADVDRRTRKAEVEAALDRVTWAGGEPVFRVRDAHRKQGERGADLIVEVLAEGAATPLCIDGRLWRASGVGLSLLSGTHTAETAGIFLAAGPDIRRQTEPLDDLRVVDMPPTFLYALALPAGEDFRGHARPDLFRPSLRRQRQPKTIPTWGRRESGAPTTSGVDDELVRQLEALGYLE